jgi:hypothetical protein
MLNIFFSVIFDGILIADTFKGSDIFYAVSCAFKWNWKY